MLARIFGSALSVRQACELVHSWLEAGGILVNADSDHFLELGRLIETAHGGANLITYGHLAALALSHNARVYTNDRDMHRFPGVKVVNPL